MKNILRNKEILNSIWIMIERIFNMFISLVISMLTARYLGPSNFGILNYTASFVAFVTSIATLGMDGVVIKKIVQFEKETGKYLGSCICYRFFSAILSTVMITIVIYLLNPKDTIKIILVLIQSGQLIMKSIQILDSWFQRYLKSKYVSIGKIIACVIVSSYKIFLLITAKSLVWFAFSNVITEAVISFVLLFYYLKYEKQSLSFSIIKGYEVLKESYHFILSGLMVAVYTQMDRIMIGQMLTDLDVGLYTTATSICGMWIFIPTAIITSFQPKIMELKFKKEEELYLEKLKQLYSCIIWLCIIVSFGVVIFAKILICILYGKAYLGAVVTLRIAIWFETFAMIGTARGIWILCEDKNRYVKYYLCIGAIVNLILNSLLIPKFGINGAAYATLVTQIITSLIAPLLFKETMIHTKLVIEAFLIKWYWKKYKVMKR
jgi:O-antigen/teichoic acid export membrane protein